MGSSASASTPLALALRRARDASGLKQAEVEAILGTSKSTVVRWESGETEPRASQLAVLARIYGCTPNDLLSGVLREVDEGAGLLAQVAQMRARLRDIDDLEAKVQALQARLDATDADA
jgi:transcriptional regulator with XRE-family HTH domain